MSHRDSTSRSREKERAIYGNNDSSSYSDDLPDQKDLEAGMIDTIVEFSKFVSSITNDLETQEKEAIEKAEANGDPMPKMRWEDSTFKINLTKHLLMTIFEPQRLIKYYILMVLPMKPWLESRDANFFVKNDHIYPGAPTEDIQFFKDLWLVKGALLDEEKDTIWEYFDTLIEIAEDWHEVTRWEPHPDEDLLMPDIDYSKAAAFANGEDVDMGERVVYAPEGGGSWVAGKKKGDVELSDSSDE